MKILKKVIQKWSEKWSKSGPESGPKSGPKSDPKSVTFWNRSHFTRRGLELVKHANFQVHTLPHPLLGTGNLLDPSGFHQSRILPRAASYEAQDEICRKNVGFEENRGGCSMRFQKLDQQAFFITSNEHF